MLEAEEVGHCIVEDSFPLLSRAHDAEFLLGLGGELQAGCDGGFEDSSNEFTVFVSLGEEVPEVGDQRVVGVAAYEESVVLGQLIFEGW